MKVTAEEINNWLITRTWHHPKNVQRKIDEKLISISKATTPAPILSAAEPASPYSCKTTPKSKSKKSNNLN
jgi:hypothetical protein